MFKTTYSRRYGEFLAALRQAREDRGLTQVQLASRLKVTQSWVSKIERGARRMDVVELEIWCKALGLTLSQFLREL